MAKLVRSHVDNEPFDRLTGICEAMSDAAEAHPEHRDNDRAIVILSNDDDAKYGLIIAGYDDERDAIADLVLNLRNLLKLGGMDIDIIHIPDDTSGLDDD